MAASGLSGATIVFIASGGERVLMPIEIARQMKFLESVEGDAPVTADSEFNVPGIKKRELDRVAAFSRAHLASPMPEIEKPLRSGNLGDHVPEWAARMVDSLGHDELFDLLEAADFFVFEALADLVAAKVAAIIKEMPDAVAARVFALSRALTPMEEAKIREEEAWAED